jgi:hypothetical protein
LNFNRYPCCRQALFSPEPDPAHGGIQGELRTPNFFFPAVLLFLFCCLVLFQIVPLPSGIVKLLSPKTYSLRHSLISDPSALRFQLSLFPFATRIEFLKWLTLAGFFLFFLSWKLSDRKISKQLIPAILVVGIAESLYGIFEFFSGHGHILYLEEPISSTERSSTGTILQAAADVDSLGVGYFFPWSWVPRLAESSQLSRWEKPSDCLWHHSDDPGSALFRIENGDLEPSFFNQPDHPSIPGPGKREKVFKNLGLHLRIGHPLGSLDRAGCGDRPVLHLYRRFRVQAANMDEYIQHREGLSLLGSGLGTFAQIFLCTGPFHPVGHPCRKRLPSASRRPVIGVGLLFPHSISVL